MAIMTDIKKVLILVETSREYGRSLIKGILDYCRFVPKWKIELPPPFYIKHNRIAIYQKAIQEGYYDGIIGHIHKPSDYHFIMNSKTPAILQSIYTHLEGEVVRTNNAGVGMKAADFFLQKGYTNVGFFGCNKLYFSTERADAFASQLQSVNFFAYSTGINTRLNEKRTEKIGNWLKELPKPIGVLACNDEWAKLLNEICILNEINVPEEVSILGVDNDEIVCKTTWPYISSIALSTEKAGLAAATLLDKMMRTGHHSTEPIIINPTYIEERQSTDIAVIKDEIVSKTLQYIKTNIDQPIQVADILEHVLVSRRSLQDKFNMVLGRSVLDQIRKMQIERVANLLVQTDLSITHISGLCGFTSFKNFSRLFKKYKQTTPTHYRQTYKTRNQQQ